MAYRLGIDIGTNSLGWCALDLDETGKPTGIQDVGVRIFSDGRNPKDKQSLAVMRRLPRQQRKRRDRYLKRRTEFMDRLIKHGLMPADETQRKALEKKNPWKLRVKGLDQKLSLYQFGRALFHIQQRRGFKSNLKIDKADDDKGKIKSAIASAQEAMKNTGARTLAEYLARPRIENPQAAPNHPVRARLRGSGANAFYDFYPSRDLIAAEFDTLWKRQKRFHGDALTEQAREDLRDTLLFQRDLKAPKVGRCTLDPTEDRAPRALPSVQHLRIYQELNHLTIRLPGETERKLSLEERNKLAIKACGFQKLKFDTARNELGLPTTARFNLEGPKRKHIDGDKTAAVLAHKNRWGAIWRELSFEAQEATVEQLLCAENEQKLIEWLEEQHGLSVDAAAAVATAPLPQGHGRLGRSATHRVLRELKKQVITFDQAVVAAGYKSHSALDFDGEVFARLPYYGEVLERQVAFGTGEPTDNLEKRIGKIANPTVHVALNQIRRVVNAVTRRHGIPSQIVVELARDLPLSAKAKWELESEQNANKAANDKRRSELKKLRQPDTYENRLRLRLWKELNPDDQLDRRCVYSGQVIGQERLFSDRIEVEHILPFSRTLDDGIGNKTLCMREANRFKGHKCPFEAFGDSPDGYSWSSIVARTAGLPPNKSWRFGPDAMERFENEERDFLSRHLNETRYIGTLSKLYLQRTGADVWVTPGRLTADLRWAWGLDSILPGHNRAEAADPEKNRRDHRHHAIDAVVVGLTDRRLLKAVATAAGRAEKRFDKRLLADIQEPWPNFRSKVQEAVSRIVVSHKPDHGVQGAMHNDTAYGFVSGPDKKGRWQVVHRVPLEDLKKTSNLDAIRDHGVREELRTATTGLDGKEFTEALLQKGASMNPPVRKARVAETLSVIPVSDANGRTYKAYKGDSNYCYDIFAGPKGNWKGDIVSRFDANQADFDPCSSMARSGQPLLMRLRQNDIVAIEEGEKKALMRVVKFSPGIIVLAEHFEAGALKKRDKDKDDPFKYRTVSPSRLQQLKARCIRVDPSGRVFDPGPPA